MKRIRDFTAIAFGVFLAVLSTPGQDPKLPTSTEGVLVDEFERTSHCEFRSRIDGFLAELSQKPDHQGYVLNYKAVDELPGDRDSYPREREIAQHISFRNFDAPRVTFVRAGYLTAARTQFWIVPPGAGPPQGLATLSVPKIPDKKTFLFARNTLASDLIVESYELGEGLDETLPEFVLESVKARERAEREELEKRIEQELIEDEQADGSETSAELRSPVDIEQEPAFEVDEPEDTRTEAEREAARYRWANVGLAELLAGRKGSGGVIIFYADDERYDIARLKQFVATGRDLLTRSASIASSRIKIVFGGYRHMPEVEFWLVPAKGKSPVPSPDERPADEPESEPEN